METKKFNRLFTLYPRKHDLENVRIPLYCINKSCVNWSSPSYCFQRFLKGYQSFPVCGYSIALYNVKQITVAPKLVQLSLNFD